MKSEFEMNQRLWQIDSMVSDVQRKINDLKSFGYEVSKNETTGEFIVTDPLDGEDGYTVHGGAEVIQEAWDILLPKRGY